MHATATVSPTGAVETGTTDGSYAVGNDTFLSAVFGNAPADTRPVVVSFDGDPAKVAAKSWFGQPWQAEPVGRDRLSPRRPSPEQECRAA